MRNSLLISFNSNILLSLIRFGFIAARRLIIFRRRPAGFRHRFRLRRRSFRHFRWGVGRA
jgi:hypothetical protein